MTRLLVVFSPCLLALAGAALAQDKPRLSPEEVDPVGRPEGFGSGQVPGKNPASHQFVLAAQPGKKK